MERDPDVVFKDNISSIHFGNKKCVSVLDKIIFHLQRLENCVQLGYINT